LKLQEDKTPVDYLISVIGFDIGLENSKLINEFDKSLKEVARQTKAQPIIVRTNYREFLDQFPPDSANLWEMCHGAGLASVALTLQSLWGKVYINSDDAHLYRIPYGTHPTLDTLWSSSLTEFICFGAKLNRLEKIRFIEHDPLTHNYLRVCWENKGNKYNCSACEKCLRTILQLKLDGVLKDFNVFEQNLNIDLQSFDSFHLPQMCRVYIWEYYYSNLKGKEDTLRQAIRHYLIKSYKRIIEKNKPYYKIKFGLKLLMLKLNLS